MNRVSEGKIEEAIREIMGNYIKLGLVVSRRIPPEPPKRPTS